MSTLKIKVEKKPMTTHHISVQHPRNCTHFFFFFFFLMCINTSAKRMEKGVWCANNKQECMQRPNLLCCVPSFLGGALVEGVQRVRASARPSLGAAQVLFMGCLCPIPVLGAAVDSLACAAPCQSFSSQGCKAPCYKMPTLCSWLALPSPGCFLGEFLL